MIVEHRTYRFRPGRVAAWVEKFGREGLPVQKRHLGRFMGLYVSEIGALHTTVMMWAYDSLADRETRRAALAADPEWQAYIGEIFALDMLVSQDVMIMNPAPYSPAVA
jgi:hypothetical protein